MKFTVSRMLVIVMSICVINIIILFRLSIKSKQHNDDKDGGNLGNMDGSSLEYNDLNRVVKYLNNTLPNQQCKIPQLNPYHPEVLPFVAESTVKECTMKQYGKVHDGILYLKVKNVQKVWLYYVVRVDDFHIKYSKRYTLLGGHDDKTDEECWEACGRKGGNCTFCGENGFCCRLGFKDCPPEAQVQATNNFHSCVYTNRDKVPANFGKECWTHCSTQTGACPSFCGEGGYCCRQGFKGCPDNIVDSKSEYHMCTIVKNVTGNLRKQDTDIQYTLQEDFFKLKLMFDGVFHEEHHAAFTKLPIPPKTNESDNMTNILMVMIDSVSRANAQRKLKKTYKYLSDDPNSYILKGQSIVGDGTTAQLCAMLTGVAEHELPEARRSVPGAKSVDSWPFIFHDFHKRGYKTMYSEDEPSLSTFQYRLHGFKVIPTTKYLRPWWFAMDNMLGKQSILCPFLIGLDYIKRFFKAYDKYKKFALLVSSTISHNSLNTVGVGDDYIVEFYKSLRRSGHLKNTVVILFGDHGCRVGKFRSTMQGKLEERLPFVSITLPQYFNSYPAHMKNFKDNVNIMTSHFDIYPTLQHILTWPHLNDKTKIKYGRSLFTDIKSLNRTCAQAGIEPHWCPCLDFEVVNATRNAAVLKLVTNAINFINLLNEKDAKGKCTLLKLHNIIRAGRRIPNLEVLEFSHSLKDNRCDSCGVKLDKSAKVLRYIYEVNFEVSPSGGQYEINRECTFNTDGSVHIVESDQISRTNIYGNAPHCLEAHQRHIEKYCFCKGFEYPS